MARLIPSFMDERTPPGERDVFNMLAAGPAEWTALHSLDLAPWNRGLRTEIDFVVIVPDRGILCVEIKSHEDEYYQTEAKDLSIPTSVYKEIYSVEHYDPAPLTAEGLALLSGTKDFLVQQHLAKQDFKVADWIVPDQAPGAKTAALPQAAPNPK